MAFDCHPLLVGMWNNSLTFTVPWVTLPAGTRTVPEFYDLDPVWSAESLEQSPAHAGESTPNVVRVAPFLLQCMSLLPKQTAI